MTVELTDREKEIAALVSQGKTSKEIGDLLGISDRTVEVHRRTILLKTKTSNNGQTE